MEQLTEMEIVSKATLKLRLKQRKVFRILKVDTLTPKGLYQELNNVQWLLSQSKLYYSTAAKKKTIIE